MLVKMGEYFSGRGIVVVAKTFQVLVQCEVAAAGRTGCKSAKEAEVKVSHAEAFILWEWECSRPTYSGQIFI